MLFSNAQLFDLPSRKIFTTVNLDVRNCCVAKESNYGGRDSNTSFMISDYDFTASVRSKSQWPQLSSHGGGNDNISSIMNGYDPTVAVPSKLLYTKKFNAGDDNSFYTLNDYDSSRPNITIKNSI
ncbi:hypothetical protein CDAR_536731 [Caerostris darwini]|uniref:Uncharacterized protein n=1 Tax=Caerostris darwini TaxID=1538125 RepID=A0AAV4VKP3_9ARAC|nr:hypothetical protein CDAR_536731 [Caerostris darwini]